MIEFFARFTTVLAILVLLFVLLFDSPAQAANFLKSSSNYTDKVIVRPMNQPVNKWDFIYMWCNGQVRSDVDCLTDDYAVYFFPVKNSSKGSMTAFWKAKKYEDRVPAVFFYITNDSDYEYMQQARTWAEAWGARAFFGTLTEAF